MKYRIEVSLKSFEHDLLSRATDQIQDRIPKEMPDIQVKVYYFPVHFQKLTVLRSPHIDKKARDQFEIRRFKNIISFDINFSSANRALLIFLNDLQNIHCSGVQIQIKISSNSYGPQRSEFELF